MPSQTFLTQGACPGYETTAAPPSVPRDELSLRQSIETLVGALAMIVERHKREIADAPNAPMALWLRGSVDANEFAIEELKGRLVRSQQNDR